MKQGWPLHNSFMPDNYLLLDASDNNSKVEIIGKKSGRPSYRITLHQNGLKVTNAKIEHIKKKTVSEITIKRINHLPSFEQVRIHTNQILYPGTYKLILVFSRNTNPHVVEGKKRRSLPSIDEPEAWKHAELRIKR